MRWCQKLQEFHSFRTIFDQFWAVVAVFGCFVRFPADFRTRCGRPHGSDPPSPSLLVPKCLTWPTPPPPPLCMSFMDDPYILFMESIVLKWTCCCCCWKVGNEKSTQREVLLPSLLPSIGDDRQEMLQKAFDRKLPWTDMETQYYDAVSSAWLHDLVSNIHLLIIRGRRLAS